MILNVDHLGPPDDYTETDEARLSNCWFEVEPGTEELLRSEKVWTRYAGWNFNGRVWLDAEGSFSCQVWVYGSPVATVRAETLDELMHEVSGEWGYG